MGKRKHAEPPDPRIPAKKQLCKRADDLWSVAVKSDWANRCAVCGSNGKLHPHHIVPRQFESLRYELMNGIALCVQHHIFDGKVAPHQNAAGWLAWLTDTYPTLANWYIDNRRPQFTGTKDAEYYIGHIRRLKQYVEAEDFSRIVGVRFEAWLEETKEGEDE